MIKTYTENTTEIFSVFISTTAYFIDLIHLSLAPSVFHCAQCATHAPRMMLFVPNEFDILFVRGNDDDYYYYLNFRSQRHGSSSGSVYW